MDDELQDEDGEENGRHRGRLVCADREAEQLRLTSGIEWEDVLWGKTRLDVEEYSSFSEDSLSFAVERRRGEWPVRARL